MCSDENFDLLFNIIGALTGDPKENLHETFCVEETLAAADIEVIVKEVGKLSFPLNKTSVQKLIGIAKFGLDEETVLDKNVRDTQVIESKNLNVTINQESLSRIMSNMQKALNLHAGSTLTPHLYNMLIYGPGQFSKRHRDSEKLPSMVATLVIILPSPHVGGDLIIQHENETHSFSSDNVDEDNAKCICFYCDCLHGVHEVKCGYRVALTFNVVLETGELLDTACANEELKSAVLDYFKTSVVQVGPKKLVFFLNHTYSEHSLLWNLLKGKDCEYAFSLRSVAGELDLEAHLVLADVNQIWSSDSNYRINLHELVYTNTTLKYWVDTNNVRLPYGECSISESEICSTLYTDCLYFDPIKEQLYPNMCDKRAAVDFLFKRAAVVLWHKSDSLLIKFEFYYDGAMTELRSLISVPGNEKVADILEKAVELSHYRTMNDFETFVNVALYVNASKKALSILSSFRLNVLVPKNVQMLIQLQKRYGIDWFIEFLDVLRQRKCGDYFSNPSMASETIHPFVLEFLNSGGDQSIMEFLLKAEITTFIIEFNNRAELERFRELFKACAAIENTELQENLAQCLISQSKFFWNSELAKLYDRLQKPCRLKFQSTCEFVWKRL